MKRVIVFAASTVLLLAACGSGQGGNTTDSAAKYPPAVLNDTSNAKAGNTMEDTTHGKLKPDGTPYQGDTSTSGNGQNTGITKDTTKRKPKQ